MKNIHWKQNNTKWNWTLNLASSSTSLSMSGPLGRFCSTSTSATCSCCPSGRFPSASSDAADMTTRKCTTIQVKVPNLTTLAEQPTTSAQNTMAAHLQPLSQCLLATWLGNGQISNANQVESSPAWNAHSHFCNSRTEYIFKYQLSTSSWKINGSYHCPWAYPRIVKSPLICTSHQVCTRMPEQYADICNVMVIYVFTFSSQKYSVNRIALPTAAMCIELPASLPKQDIACEMNTRLQYFSITQILTCQSSPALSWNTLSLITESQWQGSEGWMWCLPHVHQPHPHLVSCSRFHRQPMSIKKFQPIWRCINRRWTTILLLIEKTCTIKGEGVENDQYEAWTR